MTGSEAGVLVALIVVLVLTVAGVRRGRRG
jgi:hypothetical protein